MRGLGRAFNVVPVADTLVIRMEDVTGVTFVCKEDTTASVYTFSQSLDGGAPAPILIDPGYHYGNGDGGVWAYSAPTGTPAATVTKGVGAGEDAVCIYVGADDLDDAYNEIICTQNGAGTVVAILHDLVVQRDPANLAAAV